MKMSHYPSQGILDDWQTKYPLEEKKEKKREKRREEEKKREERGEGMREKVEGEREGNERRGSLDGCSFEANYAEKSLLSLRRIA